MLEETMELKDVIATLADTPDILKIYLNDLSDEQLHLQPGGGYFSALEIICHLRDIEIEGYRVRVQRLLAERLPNLPDIDGGKLARERRYNRQELQPALDAFIQARYTNLRILEKLTKTQLARTGMFEPLGKISLGRLLELWVEHDQVHIKELEQLQAGVRELQVSHSTGPSLSVGRC
jgi:hypothetical protein